MITGQNANAKMSWPKITLQKMVAKNPKLFSNNGIYKNIQEKIILKYS